MHLINNSHICCSEDLSLLELEAVHFSHASRQVAHCQFHWNHWDVGVAVTTVSTDTGCKGRHQDLICSHTVSGRGVQEGLITLRAFTVTVEQIERIDSNKETVLLSSL